MSTVQLMGGKGYDTPIVMHSDIYNIGVNISWEL